jgi:hypothetical protein
LRKYQPVAIAPALIGSLLKLGGGRRPSSAIKSHYHRRVEQAGGLRLERTTRSTYDMGVPVRCGPPNSTDTTLLHTCLTWEEVNSGVKRAEGASLDISINEKGLHYRAFLFIW